jgi:hypothetical protein
MFCALNMYFPHILGIRLSTFRVSSICTIIFSANFLISQKEVSIRKKIFSLSTMPDDFKEKKKEKRKNIMGVYIHVYGRKNLFLCYPYKKHALCVHGECAYPPKKHEELPYT